MDATLKVILTRDRHNKPLAQVCNLPGEDAEFYPEQLQSLIAALAACVNELEHRPPTHVRPLLREYELTTGERVVEIGANKELQMMAAIITLQMTVANDSHRVIAAANRLSLLAMEALGLPVETLPAQSRPH